MPRVNAAVSSIARGMPSRRRQIRTTVAALCSKHQLGVHVRSVWAPTVAFRLNLAGDAPDARRRTSVEAEPLLGRGAPGEALTGHRAVRAPHHIAPAYATPQELGDDLAVIDRSLRAAGLAALARGGPSKDD